MLANEWDVVFVQDPQPTALWANNPVPGARRTSQCHIDTSTPDRDTWAFLRPFVFAYNAHVFTLASSAPAEIEHDRLAAIAQAIDPLSTKNRPLPDFLARSAVAAAGIDPAPCKYPASILEGPTRGRRSVAARAQQVPGLQLALVGAVADDDPEGWQIYEFAREATASEPDCHLLTNQTGVGPLELNASSARPTSSYRSRCGKASA